MATGHELAIFGSGTESTTESTLLSSMGKEGHHRRLATERKKEAERQLEVAKEKKAKEDAKTRLRQEEAARFTDQQRLWWDEEVVHQVAVSRNNFYAEEVRFLSLGTAPDMHTLCDPHAGTTPHRPSAPAHFRRVAVGGSRGGRPPCEGGR